MPKRATGYQATSGFADDASLYDSSISTGYEQTFAGSSVAGTGKLDLGASPTPVKTLSGYTKWAGVLTLSVQYSTDDITYSTPAASIPVLSDHAGLYSGQLLNVTLVTPISAQYWRWSARDTFSGSGSAAARLGLMELEAKDGSGVHIPENPAGLVSGSASGATASAGTSTGATDARAASGASSSAGSAAAALVTTGARASGKTKSAGYGIGNLNAPASASGATVSAGTATQTGYQLASGATVSAGVASPSVLQPASAGGVSTSAGVAGAGDFTVWAQPLFDWIDWYPGIGDVFGFTDGAFYDNGKFGGAIELRTGKVLRGAAWGLVLAQSPREAYPGANIYVTENQDPFAPGGSGTSDSTGRYSTGSPEGRGNILQKIECRVGDSPYPASASTFKARKRNRHSFLKSQPANHASVETASERGWLHVSRAKKVYTYYAGTSEQVFASPDLAFDYCTKMRWEPRRSTLYLAGPVSAAQKVYRSTDGGQSIAEIASVTGKSQAIEVDSERGLLLWLYQDNSDTIYLAQSTDGGATWGSAAGVTLDGAALKGAVLDMTYDRRRSTLFATVQSTGSNPTIRVIASNDSGATWKTSIS